MQKEPSIDVLLGDGPQIGSSAMICKDGAKALLSNAAQAGSAPPRVLARETKKGKLVPGYHAELLY